MTDPTIEDEVRFILSQRVIHTWDEEQQKQLEEFEQAEAKSFAKHDIFWGIASMCLSFYMVTIPSATAFQMISSLVWSLVCSWFSYVCFVSAYEYTGYP